MATNQTGIPNSINTKVSFTTEVFDINNKYDSTNSRWTPVAGTVVIGAGLLFLSGIRNNTFPQVMIFKNGGCIAQSGAQTSTDTSIAPITIVDYANGTDYYECYANASSAGTSTIGAVNFVTTFYGAAL
jgi:hypothetical protein